MSSPSNKKRVLILGATGPLGLLTVKEALSRNFEVTIYVRNSQKLPDEIKGNKKVTVLIGTLTEAPEALFPSLTTFPTIISALGPNPSLRKRYTGTPLADFYATLLQNLSSLPKSQPRPYILALCTPSQPDPKDSFNLLLFIGLFFLRLLFKGVYDEVRACASAFQMYGEGTPWTLYRVGNLMNGAGKGVAKAGYVGDLSWKMSTNRIEIAKWLVEQAELDGEERKWLGKMPAISGS